MKKSIFSALCLVLLATTTQNAWGAEEVYKTALFGSEYNSKSINSYTDSFSATNSNFTVDLTNFNNNQNGWNYVKTGNKSNAAVGTITTNTAIDKAVTRIAITIDAITSSSVNSITLYSGTSSSNITTIEGTFSKTQGVQSVEITSPEANKFYKISFDCKKGSSNGLVTISKVEYFINSSGSGETTLYLGLFLAAFVAVRACARRVECLYATFHHIIMSKIDFRSVHFAKALFVSFLGFVLFLSIKCRFLSFFFGEHVQICITSMVCIETAYDILSHCRNALPEPLSPCLGGGVSG